MLWCKGLRKQFFLLMIQVAPTGKLYSITFITMFISKVPPRKHFKITTSKAYITETPISSSTKWKHWQGSLILWDDLMEEYPYASIQPSNCGKPAWKTLWTSQWAFAFAYHDYPFHSLSWPYNISHFFSIVIECVFCFLLNTKL